MFDRYGGVLGGMEEEVLPREVPARTKGRTEPSLLQESVWGLYTVICTSPNLNHFIRAALLIGVLITRYLPCLSVRCSVPGMVCARGDTRRMQAGPAASRI